MAATKNFSRELSATGGRTIELTTQNGAQVVSRYHAVDTVGSGYACSFTVAEVLAAHPEIDPAILATYLGIFRAYGDALLGFVEP